MNKFIQYQNKKIFYRVTGTGNPVILIHGFGEDGEVWNNQVRPAQTPHKEGLPTAQSQLTQHSLLSEKFRLIIPDLPGSGQSEMVDDMSMEGMAEVIKSIIDVEGAPELRSFPSLHSGTSEGGALESSKSVRPFTLSENKNPPSEGREAACVIGHSMGGYILLALMEKYPNLVSAFGLFHSSSFADSEEKKATRKKGIEFIQQNGAAEFLKTATPNLFSPITKKERPELVKQQVAASNNFSAAALVSYYEAMIQRPDRTDVLRKATVPVLFIMGKYDVAVPMEDSLKQCHLPEKSYIHILQKSGHMGMLEEPDKSNEILEKFLLDM